MSFPNVYDIGTEALFEGNAARMGGDMCPTDSESEYDSYSSADENDEILNIDVNDLVTKIKNKTSVQNNFMLFKPCRDEVENKVEALEIQTMEVR